MDFYFGEEKMKTRGIKRMVKLDFFFSKIALFGHVLGKKKSTHSFFWCMVIPLGPHSVYRGPKAL